MKKMILICSVLAAFTWTTAVTVNAKVTKLTMATSHPVDHMATEIVKKTIKKIETGTKNRVKINLFPANQLGDYVQVYDEVMRGTIDMAHISVPETHDKRLGACMLPYLTPDYASVKKVLGQDSNLYKQTSQFHQKLGVKFLGFFTEGFIGIGTVKKASVPATPGRDKGALIRTSGMATMVTSANGIGFRTTTIPYADVFPALQTGVADGWIGGPANLNYLIFRDVIKFFYNYNVTQEITQAIMNSEKMSKLTPADQKVIIDAFREFSIQSFELSEQEDNKYRALLRKAGVEVVEFSPEEMSAISKSVREFSWPKLEEVYTSELMDLIQKDINK